MKTLVIAAIVIALLAGLAFAPLPFHDHTRIASSIVIARSPDTVFAYVTKPANWPKWHPASLAVAGAIDHSLVPGEQVTEDFIVAGRKGRVIWTARKRDANRQWIIEGDVDGRDAGTITYTLTPVPEGTRFEREFVYPSPTLFFAALNRISIRSKVEEESTQALQNLKRVLEGAPR